MIVYYSFFFFNHKKIKFFNFQNYDSFSSYLIHLSIERCSIKIWKSLFSSSFLFNNFLSSIPSFLLLLLFNLFIEFLFQLEPGNLYSEYRMKFSLLGLRIYSTEYQSAQSTRVHKVPECTRYQSAQGTRVHKVPECTKYQSAQIIATTITKSIPNQTVTSFHKASQPFCVNKKYKNLYNFQYNLLKNNIAKSNICFFLVRIKQSAVIQCEHNKNPSFKDNYKKSVNINIHLSFVRIAKLWFTVNMINIYPLRMPI